MKILTTIPDTLKLAVSDLGDGGWSLHDARDTDEMIADGDSMVLASDDTPILSMHVDHALARLDAKHAGTRIADCSDCIDAMFAKLGGHAQ